MRAGLLCSSRGRSRLVSRNGPRTLVAKVSSILSTESVRSLASVVDEHVEAPGLAAEALGELPDGFEVAEVAETNPNVAVGRACHDLRVGKLAALLAAGRQPHRRAETREALGGGEAEPRGPTGDEHDLTAHRLHLGSAPHAPAHAIADTRVALEDDAVEDRVEQ
jgi:hypothetical protein